MMEGACKSGGGGAVALTAGHIELSAISKKVEPDVVAVDKIVNEKCTPYWICACAMSRT